MVVGGLGPLAGWAAVGGLSGFPWLMAVQGTLAGAALYIPTTLTDLKPDRVAGYRTFAVALGRTRAYRAGLACWLAAALLSVVLAATGTVLPRRMVPFEVILVPVLVAAYHLVLRRHQDLTRIAFVATLFLAPSGLFALTYTGVLG